MHNRRRHCRRLLYRGAGLVLLTPLLLGSGLISGGGGGGGGTPGTGDIEQVFSCTTGPCTNITVDTGQSLGTTGSGSIAATTAAALAANPTDCTVGQFANAIAANGNLTCAAASVTLPDADDDATTKGVVTFLNTEFDCVAGLCNIAAGGITNGDLSSTYSGVGACAANTWASTLNDNAVPTCTQPAFTNISGSVTDAQVPNTITVDLATAATALAANPVDCTSGQFANAIAANGDLTCATPAAGSSLLQVTDVTSGGTLLARTFGDGAGVIRLVEVFPETTIKTDEGAAATAGTVAWAEAQLTAGGEIFLHAGQYNVGTTIVMDVAGTTLRCADPQTAELKAKTNLNSTILNLGWAGAQRQGMQVLGCGFNGNPANQSTSGTLIALKDVADARIEGNYFRYWKTKGMTIGCSIGVVGAPQCVETLIARNLFYASGGAAGGGGSGIEILATATNPITDSRIINNDIGGAANDGNNSSAWIKIGNGTGMGTNGWSFQGNHIYGTDRGACIEIADPTANTIDIQNNTLESCTGAIKWTGDALGSAGWSLVQGNKMYGYSRQCSTVGAGSYLGKRCAADADCGVGGVCAVAGPKVFDFNRVLRVTVANNEMRSQQGGVTSFISLADAAAAGGSNHNQVTGNMIDFTLAGEKGITLANSSNNNFISNNRCRGIGGGGGGTCIDGGTISNNQFMSNVCNNTCTALETNMPTLANQIHDLNTNVGDVGDFTCATGATSCTLDTGVVTDAKLASNYSGVGACAASTWASTLNDNATPTCTQPAFTDISGSVTDAQVPNTITVDLATAATALAANPTDCTTNQFATAIVASGNLTCAQPNFTDLAGTATAAQTPLATLLAGRSGTGNDTTLSTSADGTLYGSTTTGMDLILRANSADTTTGEVLVNSPQIRTPGFLLFDPDATAGKTFIQYFDGTETFSGAVLLNELTSGTYTMNNGASTIGAFSAPLTVVLDWTVAPSFASSFFFAGPKIRASTAISSRLFRPFLAAPTFDANAATLTLTDNGMFEATPTYTITSAGVIAGSQRGFYTTATVGASATLPQWRGYVFDDATGSGAVTTQVGVDIAALSKATTNIGLRNADTTVYTPATQAIAAAANTVTCSATVVNLTTVAGSTTFTSNPTVADGTAGQVCTLMNTDATATDCLVFTDATLGLQLAGNFTMCPNDTLTLEYNGTDWIELSRSDADNSEPRTACVALDNVTTAVLRRYWIAPASGANITAVSCVYGDLDGSAACTSAPTVEWEDQAGNVVTSSGITCTSTTGTWTATTGALTAGELLTLDVVTAADTDCDIVACAQYSF